jgi:hypothetical protein
VRNFFDFSKGGNFLENLPVLGPTLLGIEPQFDYLCRVPMLK